MKLDEIVVRLADYTRNNDNKSFDEFALNLENYDLLKLREFGFALEQFAANELIKKRW